jgi:peptide deformylase
MRLKIVQVGEPVLRERARPLTPDEIASREIRDLIDSMRETMHDAPGVGLAAPQIGVPFQLAVIEDKAEYTRDSPAAFLKERERKPVPFHVIINPQLTLGDGATVEFFEGCLSLAGYTGVVARSRSVRVDCLDHRGSVVRMDASGWYARILQHEIDHLHGTVYIDRVQTRSLMTVENFNRYWKDQPMPKVRKSIGWGQATERS